MIDSGVALLIEVEPIFIPIIYENLLSRLYAASGFDEHFLPRLHAQLGVMGHSLHLWKLPISFVQFEARQ